MPSRFKSEPTLEELQAVASRIEARPGGAVAWALDFAQRNLSAMTAGDWYNVRLELAGWLLPFQESPEAEELLSEEEVRRVQRRIANIVASLLRDGRAPIGRYDINLVVAPGGAISMLLQSPSVEGPYITRLLVILFARQTVIRKCVAPSPRGQSGENCGRWFLATRRSQSYCSRRCQSRASTQAFRHARNRLESRRGSIRRRRRATR